MFPVEKVAMAPARVQVALVVVGPTRARLPARSAAACTGSLMRTDEEEGSTSIASSNGTLYSSSSARLITVV